MEDLTIAPPVDDQAAFGLGEMLGRRQTFGMISGRCSAADAECLRRMRDQKLYRSRATSWNGFCPKFLGMTSRHANRIIRNLEEFGPGYFELAQLTRITPEQFRAIAPAVRDRSIQTHGGAIALIPENAEKIASAVADLRRDAAVRAGKKDDRIDAVDRRCEQVVAEIQRIADGKPAGADKLLLRATIRKAIVSLRMADLAMGV
jgi:hypothetical protein